MYIKTVIHIICTATKPDREVPKKCIYIYIYIRCIFLPKLYMKSAPGETVCRRQNDRFCSRGIHCFTPLVVLINIVRSTIYAKTSVNLTHWLFCIDFFLKTNVMDFFKSSMIRKKKHWKNGLFFGSLWRMHVARCSWPFQGQQVTTHFHRYRFIPGFTRQIETW